MKRVRELGRGASGVVYEIADPPRALKVLHEPSVRARDLFDRGRALSHRGLVRLLDWVQGEGFTMELVVGHDLVTHVRGHGSAGFEGGRPNIPVAFGQRLQPEGTSAYEACDDAGIERLRAAIPQLVSALECLHGADLVHGDLRPSNVVVTGEGRVVLLDLGTSEASAAYAAPELVSSPAADWYALGTLLFECLTGQLPFFGSAQHVLVTKTTVPPPRASFLVRGVPDDLDDLVVRLLSRDPERRTTKIVRP